MSVRSFFFSPWRKEDQIEKTPSCDACPASKIWQSTYFLCCILFQIEYIWAWFKTSTFKTQTFTVGCSGYLLYYFLTYISYYLSANNEILLSSLGEHFFLMIMFLAFRLKWTVYSQGWIASRVGSRFTVGSTGLSWEYGPLNLNMS